MSSRPWCCPEPRCIPLYAAQGGDQPLDVPQPGEMFVCFGKAPAEVVFVYDGVEHRNDLRQCSYTALKGLIAFQENADDWRGIQNAYGRALRALEHHERAAQEANEVIVSALSNPHGHVEWTVGGSDTPADQLEQDVQQESDAYCVGCRRWHQPGPCAAYDGLCGEACVQNAFLRCRLSPGHAGLHNDTEGSTWAPVLADQGESSDE